MNQNNKPEIYIAGQRDILNATSMVDFNSILDIGLGRAGASKFFANKSKKVTSIGLNIKDYNLDFAELDRLDIKMIECSVENMSFPNESFDAVWMAHILEHTMNPGIALQQVRRVLKPEGWLFISVPPYESKIVTGHIYTGWNIGQLMYLLLLNGFDIKSGHFVTHGYNVTGFVQKSSTPLPRMNFNSDDMAILANFWPKPLKHGFEGNVSQVNWPGFKTNYLAKELGFMDYLKHKLKGLLLRKTTS